ncbi:MAG: hypothetical protein NT019_03180 [Candidatus Adlerbacteria bacterium]|nr:hypothetical protein [Candidatus Adlerbacteria bacterium]
MAAKKVIVVDDDEMVVAGMCILLKEQGYDTLGLAIGKSGEKQGVVYSSNLEHAAGLVRGFKPNLVLLDHTLISAFNGTDLAKAAKVPKKRCISISTTYRQEEACADMLLADKSKLAGVGAAIPTEREEIQADIDRFLKQVAKVTGTK